MNIIRGNQDRLGLAPSTQVAFLLIISLLLWTMGAPALLQKAHAANLTSISDTLSTSNLGTLSKHLIQYTNATSTIAGQTIKVQFDPTGSAFTEAFSSATSTDIVFFDNGSPVTVANSCGTNSVVPVGNYNNGSDENITFTLCPSTTILAGHTISIGIGTSTRLITNPAAAGSYRILVGGTQDNTGETRVAVLQNVTLTAAVNTSFTFTVTGLATSSTLIAGTATTTASSTATALPFSTLASGTPVTLAQQLNVSTNARNGFSVTVQENQPPTSSTGATIDLFANGATSTTPISWTAPTAVLDVPSTYGHLGITTDDTTDGTAVPNEFGGGTLWAGNIDLPRVVFGHNGPADGTTQGKGKATVAYRIQISDLQEAGTDYTNTITYVATPTF